MTHTTRPQTTTLTELHAGFQQPDPAARPMMRWWWFGPDVTREDLTRDLDAMQAAGIGGVECAFVYPLGSTSDRFGSPTFLADVQFAAEAAAQRGLRFDLTLGSGWPYGGPHIDEHTASRRIHWEREEVLMQPARIPVPHTWPGDTFIAAYIGEGTRGDRPQEFSRLEVEDNQIIIPAGHGPRVLLLAVSRLSGQTMKRASHGAEGWVLDHLNPEAAQAHIRAVAEPLVAAAGPENIGTVFCDSLEVYDSNWTPNLPQEFQKRRGYDVVNHLWKLTESSAAGKEFRADYHRTLTELLEENFIAVFARWAESKNLRFRIQGYGQPPATVSSYRNAHDFEGEGWGWDVVTACKWAASAGQLYGQNVISSETWTWNHSPSFRSTPLDILGETHDHILSGVNHFIGHGWPTSPRPSNPAEVGRVFYASGAFDDRNAWWDAAPNLWGSIHRLAWIMRQGQRLSDIGIYVPARDIYASFTPGSGVDLYKKTRTHIGQQIPHAIRTAGHDYDLFDDDAVASLDPARFPVVVLPFAAEVPAATRVWLEQVIGAGGVVLDCGGQAGVGVSLSGERAVAARDILDYAPDAPVRITVTDPSGQSVPNTAVAITTRELDGPLGSGVSSVRIHFVANTSAVTQQVELSFATPVLGPPVVERWDAETGRVVSRNDGSQPLPLDLEAYQAVVLIEHTDRTRLISDPGEVLEQSASLEGWSVAFEDQEPSPVQLPHQWEQTPGRQTYSGSATYTTEVTIPAEAGRVVLDLGTAEPHTLEDPAQAGLMEASFSADVLPPVGVVATVLCDSTQVGVLWKTPYRVDITEAATPGQRHRIQLVVSNVTSHTLATDPALPALVAETEAHFGRRFGIQALELALADVASGLLKTPTLRWSRASV